MLVIIDNYDSFTYNLFQYIQELTEEDVTVIRNDQVKISELAALQPSRVILSPGPGHPANAVDFGVCADVLVRHSELKTTKGAAVPVLGVCLGHQGIAHYFGGDVIGAPRIMHGKTSVVKVVGKTPLYDSLPDSFEAMRYHSLVADDKSLPECLTVTARDQTDGLIMSLQHKQLPIYGVQFHPESIGTAIGKRILENFVSKC